MGIDWLDNFNSDLTKALKPINDWVNDYPDVFIWYVTFIFVIVAALLFLWKFKAMQITTLPEQVKLIKPTAGESADGTKKKDAISAFQAFCVSMGARVGVGNITGVTSAIIMGGAGAVFWMWIFALLGAVTSFVECTLAQIFKEKKNDGNYHGGPAYYIKNGLKNHKFALFVAFWIIVTYGVGFIANQAANSASAFTRMDALSDVSGITIILGVIFAVATAVLIFGGIKRVAKASEYLVPVMVVIWLLIGIIAIIINIDKLGWACGEIIGTAFDFDKILAGFAGSCIMWGLKRGVFSNEAGIGSVPNVAAQSDVAHPVRQGLIQSIGVLIDTIVVCSITAFMVLTCLPKEIAYPDNNGAMHTLTDGWNSIWAIPTNDDTFARSTDWAMSTVQSALSNAMGGDWILWVLAIFMFVFAFSSLIAYYSMSEANLRFIKDNENAVKALRIFIVIVVFLACVVPVSLVWNICDVFMAIMGILNISALLFLWKYVHLAYKDYRKQKAEGVSEPVFDLATFDNKGLDTSGIKEWGSKN